MQRLATQDDTSEPSELTVFPGHRLGKGAVNIKPYDPHAVPSADPKRELAGNTTPTDPRSQRIRASRKGRHVTSSGSQPNVCGRPARTFVLPAPHVPDGLTITRFLNEAADTRAPKSSCRIMEFASASIAPSWMNSIEWRSAKDLRTIDELQTDLDAWITEYNEHRPHQGRWCLAKTPMQTFLDALPLAKEKLMAA